MGVDFYVHRKNSKTAPCTKGPLPNIEAHFAFTEYPRFLAKLAHDAGLGGAWKQLEKAEDKLCDRIFESSFGERQNTCGKKQPRKNRGRGKSSQPKRDEDQDRKNLEQGIKQAQERLMRLAKREPLVEFLLAPRAGGKLDAAACARIAPSLRYIAAKWEPAPEGYEGWREHALEIAAAMEIAGQDPAVEFVISG